MSTVLTMYEKPPGKGAKHCRTPCATSIGALSYIFCRLFEHSGISRHGHHQFRQARTPVKTDRFAHLHAFAFLCIIPDKSLRAPPGSRGAVLELGAGVHGDILKDLMKDREGIERAVQLLINPPRSRK